MEADQDPGPPQKEELRSNPPGPKNPSTSMIALGANLVAGVNTFGPPLPESA